MKTIGVLGGMGPAATAHFFTRLVALCPASCDQEHPPTLAYSASQIPDRTAHLTEGAEDPTPALQQAARVLRRAGADLIAIPCNTAHGYHAAIQEAVDIPVLHMIRLASEHIRATHPEASGVGVLAATGTIATGLYERELARVGLRAVQPEPTLQETVMDAIRAVKGGRRGTDERLVAAGGRLRDEGADLLLLGCTELPLAIESTLASLPVVDATEILALECLRRAGGLER